MCVAPTVPDVTRKDGRAEPEHEKRGPMRDVVLSLV